MADKLANYSDQSSRTGQDLTLTSSYNGKKTLFSGPELLAALFIFFAAVLAVQIYGFDAPMIYDSLDWRNSKLHVHAKHEPLSVIEIMPERALFLLSLHFNYSIHGMDPTYFRVFNALILAASGVALMVMLNMIMLLHPSGIRAAGENARLIIFLCALFYVIHPLQVFAVLYIWQRGTLMACLFYFSALASYAAGRERAIRNPVLAYLLTAILFFLGMLSKENLITLPVAIVLLEFIFFRKSLRELAKRAATVGIVALAPLLLYLFLAYYLRGPESISPSLSQRLSQNFQESGITWLSMILTESRVWFVYLASIIVPSSSELQLVRAMEVSVSLFDPPITAWACLGIVGPVLLGLAVRTREPLLSFGLLFFIIALIPESLLTPQYLFSGYRPLLPMAGMMLILARGLILVSTAIRAKTSLAAPKPVLVVVMSLAVVYLGFTTYSISSRWAPLWVWEHSFSGLPKYSERVETASYLDIATNYGLELTKSGDYGAAVEVLGQIADIPAAARLRKNREVLLRLGSILALMGKRDEAIKRFKQATQVSPRWALPYNRLGGLYLEAGEMPTALENFNTAVRLDPSLPMSHYSLGTTLLLMGDNEQAIHSLKKALELKPDYPQASANLGKALLNLGRLNEAVHHLKTAVAAFPHHAELHSSLAVAYEKLGQSQEAELHLRRAPEIEPNRHPLSSDQ